MRLSSKDSANIVAIVKNVDPNAKIYLYGSRADDTKKGGDIDLWIVSESLTLDDKITLVLQIKDKIGDQKIDLTIKNATDSHKDVFFKSLHSKVELTQEV